MGLYGVLAYTVSQRTRELGLRMALGADAGRVRRLVLSQVGRMTLIGGALGLAGALALGRLARSMLFQLEGHDPVVLAAAVAALAGVAFLAGWVPAWRASRVDPMTRCAGSSARGAGAASLRSGRRSHPQLRFPPPPPEGRKHDRLSRPGGGYI